MPSTLNRYGRRQSQMFLVSRAARNAQLYSEEAKSSSRGSIIPPVSKPCFRTARSWVLGVCACFAFLWITQCSLKAIVAISLFGLWAVAGMIRRWLGRPHDE